MFYTFQDRNNILHSVINTTLPYNVKFFPRSIPIRSSHHRPACLTLPVSIIDDISDWTPCFSLISPAMAVAHKDSSITGPTTYLHWNGVFNFHSHSPHIQDVPAASSGCDAKSFIGTYVHEPPPPINNRFRIRQVKNGVFIEYPFPIPHILVFVPDFCDAKIHTRYTHESFLNPDTRF
jgi:hypothetical protein